MGSSGTARLKSPGSKVACCAAAANTGAFPGWFNMLKRLLSVVPLLLALTAVRVYAQGEMKALRGSRHQHHAPELDPKASAAALALLVGGTLLLSERRRRQEP